MKIFLTGGAGYIGSHACVELLNAGYGVVAYDNFSNGFMKSIQRVETITNKNIEVVKGDVRDEISLSKALIGCDAVMHFAGLKAVGESIIKPLEYYDNNVQGALCLLRAMIKNRIKKLVVSSSATVYGEPQKLPISENHQLSTTNPYGQTKLVVEKILRDLYNSDNSWHIALLRYFNPVGAHKSGMIGEDVNGIPNNLMPYIAQVASGERKYLNVWGGDYQTHDGTGVRDYIHVVDLVLGHIKALENIDKLSCDAINLGTGRGYSVLDVVKAFSKASGRNISYKIAKRRSGDVAACYADPTLAKQLFGWEAVRNLDEMCLDAWNWQIKNPNGYM